VRRIAFRVAAADKEALLDALLPLLPGGVSERPDGDEVELAAVGAALPHRPALEAAAGAPLAGWEDTHVSADWRERRARFGGGGFVVAGRILLRSPDDPPATDPHVLDLVLERGGGGFGSGSHTTTRMCLELLLGVEPDGSAVDLGCGLGTLAIAAARLGWGPVSGTDRMAEAVQVARANGERNGAAVEWSVTDLEADPVPTAALLLVNAPPPVHARAAAALGTETRHVIASGVVGGELADVVHGYEAAGLRPRAQREEDGWAAVRLERVAGA